MKEILIKLAVLAVVAVVGTAMPAYADKFNAVCEGPNAANLSPEVRQDICEGTVNDDRSLMDVIQSIIKVALSVIGIVAVFVLVIAGQRYITAQGDPGKLKMAKDMILWGLVGLVVALLAYAIVSFITSVVPGEG